MATAIALGLVLLGACSRLVGLPLGAPPMGALSLYAGSRLPRRWAFLVPVAAMVVADLVLDRFLYPTYQRSPLSITRLTSYGTLALVAYLSGLRREAGPLLRAGMSIGASTLFFLTTNFAVWATQQEQTYPFTPVGLLACYVAALPFFGNSLVGDLVGTAGLFGVDALARRVPLSDAAVVAKTE